MKKILCLLSILLVSVSANALVYYDIAPGTGFSEPLSDGDVIEISNTTQQSPLDTVVNSWWYLYFNSNYLGEVQTSAGVFTIDTLGNAVGSDSLNVGAYDYANGVKLDLYIYDGTPPNLHAESNNMLQVAPTAAIAPSTSTWGLIILLLAVPAIILWRN